MDETGVRRRDLFAGASAGLAAGMLPGQLSAAVPQDRWARLEDFKAGVGTGGDDAEALESALAGTPDDGILVLPAGKTLNLSRTIDVTRGSLTVIAHGARLRIAERSSWSPLVIRAGAKGLLRWYGGAFDGNVAGQWYPGHYAGGAYPDGFPASRMGPAWDPELFESYKSMGNGGLLTVVGFGTAAVHDVTLDGVVRNGLSLIHCRQVAVSGLTASGGVPYEYHEMKAAGQRPIEAAYLKVHHGLATDRITGDAPDSVVIENVATSGGCIGIFIRSNPRRGEHRERPHSNVLISNVSVRGVSRRAGWFEHPGRVMITNWQSSGEYAPAGEVRGRAGGIVVGSRTGSVNLTNFSIAHGDLIIKTPKRHGPYMAQSGSIWCSRPGTACARGLDRLRDVTLRGAHGTDRVDEIIDCDLAAITAAPVQKARRITGCTIGALRRTATLWSSGPLDAGAKRFDTEDDDLFEVLEVMRVNAEDGQPHLLSEIDYEWREGSPVVTTDRGAAAGDVVVIRYLRRLRQRSTPAAGTTRIGDLGASAEVLRVRQNGKEVPFQIVREKKTGRQGLKVEATRAGARIEIEHLPELEPNGLVHLLGDAEVSNSRLVAVEGVRVHARTGGDLRMSGVTILAGGRPKRGQSLLRLDAPPRRLILRDCRFDGVFAPNVIEVAAGDATPRDYEIINCAFADWGLAPRQGGNAGWVFLYRKAHAGFLLVTDGVTLEHSGAGWAGGASSSFIKIEGPARGAIHNLRARGPKISAEIAGGAATVTGTTPISLDPG